MSKSVPKTRYQTHRLQLRYGEDLRTALERQKATTGASYSEIIRRAVLGMPPPPPLAPPLAQWDQEAVAALNKIGVNLNQIARRVHQTPGSPITKNEFVAIDMALVAVLRFTFGLTDKMEIVKGYHLSDKIPTDKTDVRA